MTTIATTHPRDMDTLTERRTGMPLQQFLDTCCLRTEAELERLLPVAEGDLARLHSAMRHAVLGGGKRLRPALAAAAFASLGGRGQGIDPVCAALEMLHSYSLAHDDLPCMDDDDQRRGRPTVHVAFDEATAVLAGDALHALAFEILARHAPVSVIAAIARAVGPEGMVGGQVLDLAAEGTTPTEAMVARIHHCKTGALIVASVLTGAALAGATESVLSQLSRYAEPLGFAFQIVDDVLELTQSAETLGKPVGSDLKHGKATYPGAVGLEAARQKADALAREATDALRGYPGDPILLLAMADVLISRDS